MASTFPELHKMRNVHVFDSHESPPNEVAGVVQYGSISIQLFYACLGEFLVCSDSESTWLLFPRSDDGSVAGQALQKESTDAMPFGNFVLLQPDMAPLDVEVLPERHLPRTLSMNISGPEPRTPATSFTARVRERDRRCCISGRTVCLQYFGTMKTVHIHPIAHADSWKARNMEQWIIDDAGPEVQGAMKINSIQNGLLLLAGVRCLWDDSLVAVNVDDDYRIISFHDPTLDGNKLFVNPDAPEKHRPSPELLRSHFRQCVLANMRGEGLRDDLWDHEDEQDLSNDVWQASWGGFSRLELELKTRLGDEGSE